MPKIDNSLPKMTMGIAVKINDTIKFYPTEIIKDNRVSDSIDGVKIYIKMNNKIPIAGTKNEILPFQLFTRRYAFILTYPSGKLYEKITLPNGYKK